MEILNADFFKRHSLEVAPDLIGKLLVHEISSSEKIVGRVVETEAYRGDDPACHAWSNHGPNGGALNPRGRSAALFGMPGTAYVYLNYGMYWLLNVVTEPEGHAGAVLIRAIEPVEGIPLMKERRPNARREIDLTNGPGKLTLAFGIGRRHHNRPLTTPPLFFADGGVRSKRSIARTARIGISKGTDLQWRFIEAGNPYVSKARPSDRGLIARR